MSLNEYTQTYNSMSGIDMLVTFAGTVIGELQGISYTVTREKVPLYTMGSADPRSFSRGKRGIAGSLVFIVFDRSALLDTLSNKTRYMANEYEVYQWQRDRGGIIRVENNDPLRQFNETSGTVGTAVAGYQGQFQGGNVITTQKVLAPPMYHDQIPPFDIVVTSANEYGHQASFAIQNVEITNCGSGLSVDDIAIDESCTFIATAIIPWGNQAKVDVRGGRRVIPRASAGLPGARGAPI